MYKRILVATDFSRGADAAVKQAEWVARQAGCPLMLVHVIADLAKLRARISYDSQQGVSTDDLEKLEGKLRKGADVRLSKLASELSLGSGQFQRQTLAGSPVVEVIRTAQKEGCDLVLTGRRGLSRVKQLLSGSTARRLVRKCPGAVWIVKQPGRGPLKSILVAVDFSDVSVLAVRHAVWLAEQADAELHLVHVIDSSDVPPDLYKKVTSGTPRLTARQRVRRAAKEHFDAFLETALPADAQIVPLKNRKVISLWRRSCDPI
jgi:nucleotide-binding universal stress UspA family protein